MSYYIYIYINIYLYIYIYVLSVTHGCSAQFLALYLKTNLEAMDLSLGVIANYSDTVDIVSINCLQSIHLTVMVSWEFNSKASKQETEAKWLNLERTCLLIDTQTSNAFFSV